MMWKEFEELAGYEVSFETYDKVIEPMYMATEISKQDFVKLINRKAVELVKTRKPMLKKMKVRNRCGEDITPNGCWYYIKWVDLIDVDIKTGKFIVAPIDDDTYRELARNTMMDGSTSYDFDYTECIDKRTKKPVVLE